MFRNTPLAGTPTFKLILGFGLCTLGGAMLYTYFKTRDEDDENANTGAPATQKTNGKAANNVQKHVKPVSIKQEVANEHIPLLVGRTGNNLSLIEEKTRTQVRFHDKDATHKICEITGLPDDVKTARTLLLNEIGRPQVVKEEMYVGQSVCGKITGRCGEAMQEICRISLAKVAVDSGGGGGRIGGGMDKRRITITGTRQQVNIARKLIEDKIDEDEDLRRAVEEVELKREPRRSPTNSVNSSMYSSQTSLSSHLPPRDKLIAARQDERPMEVYVSAIASPAKFWVQLIGRQSKKLDDMVQAMTEYYSEPANCALHQISEPYLGQIVAAIFKYDGKWYRAEIVGILPNQYNPNEVVLDLYFVDYGDSEYVSPNEVYELRTDFLTLRFQAVECFLANIKSTLSNEPETWEPQSIQKFEELTQVASWKKLIARVVTYKERPKAINSGVARESSQIPGVELFDITEGVEVNIGHMLISHGFALPGDNQRARSPYYAKTPEPPAVYGMQLPSPQLKNCSNESLSTLGEDAFIEKQLQHLQKSKHLYLNGNSNGNFDNNHVVVPNFNAEFYNGKLANGNGTTIDTSAALPPITATTAAAAVNTKLNGNIIR